MLRADAVKFRKIADEIRNINPNDDIRDPALPTPSEEMSDEELEAHYNRECAEADAENEADYYRDWEAKS